MEVFNQRLEQEYNTSVILTTPTVPYKAVLSSAKLIKVLQYLILLCMRIKGKTY
jgi:translation elongation factor EF-4